MKTMLHRALLVLCALLISACGGPEGRSSTEGANPRRQALQAPTTDEVEALFDWAQSRYPELFPSPTTTLQLPPWRYRHYAQTGNYLGVADGQVAVLGNFTGGNVMYVGTLAQFKCQVSIDACTPTSVSRIQSAGLADFGLTDDGRLLYAVRAPEFSNSALLPEAVAVEGTAMKQVAAGVQQFELGGFGGMYLDAEGNVFAWGNDISGWIGGIFGSLQYVTKPRKLPWPGLVKQIGFADNTAIALLRDGTVWKLPGGPPAISSGDYNVKPARLGDLQGVRLLGRGGTQLHVVDGAGVVHAADADLTRFTVVPNTRDVVALSCSVRCLGIQSDGRVIAWGAGPLGDGSERSSAAAVATMLPAPMVQVAAGRQSGLALTASGQLWVWGGEEVNRSARRRLVPIHLASAGAVIDVSCTSICLIRRSDGSVWQMSVNGLDAMGNPLPITPMMPLPGLRLF